MNAIAQQLYRSGMISLDVACEIERLAVEHQRAERERMAWEAFKIFISMPNFNGRFNCAVDDAFNSTSAFLAERDKQRGNKA